MREIAEIELAIQGGTEKIEQLGASLSLLEVFDLRIEATSWQVNRAMWMHQCGRCKRLKP
jgi:hypothetical protein